MWCECYLTSAFCSQLYYNFFAVVFQVDAELQKELEQWNDMLKNDAIKLCQENNFITGFFEGSDSNYVVDAYELKVQFKNNGTILIVTFG